MRRFFGFVLALIVVAGCAATPAASDKPLKKVTVGMPYIPNIQFAAFYVAKSQGYFEAAGLDVSFDYNYENDVVKRVATGSGIDFALASADTILLARSQAVPVKAVMATSQQFPVGFISKKDVALASAADLKGKVVGIPGRFGASYFGLNALLSSAGLKESDITLLEIGFAQTPALLEDKVQVISGYINNEPLQLKNSGVDINVLAVGTTIDVASDHLIVSEKMLTDDKATVAAFVGALRQGMQKAIDDPKLALEDSMKLIPEADRGDQTVAAAVLAATTPMWQRDGAALGQIQPDAWKRSAEVLQSMGSLPADAAVDTAYDTSIVTQ
jgi:NitT/TauT family transport system substrate-binding protein